MPDWEEREIPAAYDPEDEAGARLPDDPDDGEDE